MATAGRIHQRGASEGRHQHLALHQKSHRKILNCWADRSSSRVRDLFVKLQKQRKRLVREAIFVHISVFPIDLPQCVVVRKTKQNLLARVPMYPV